MKKVILGLFMALALLVLPTGVRAEEAYTLPAPTEETSLSRIVQDAADQTKFGYWDATTNPESPAYAAGLTSLSLEGYTGLYYFDETSHCALLNTLKDCSGSLYYFGSDGKAVTNYFDGTYYFGGDGKAVSNRVVKLTENGADHYLYLQADKTVCRPTTAKLVKVGGKFYLLSKTTGYCVTKKWANATYQKVKSKYYFNASGQAVVGRNKIGNKYYFFDKQGRLTPGWHKSGKTYVYYNQKTGAQQFANNYMYTAYKRILNDSSKTKYYIVSDIDHCWVFIFQGKKGNWGPIKLWRCTVGKKSTPTITGKYQVGYRGKSFGSGFTCYYYTQIKGGYLFHSVIYNAKGNKVTDGRLGKKLSHGCIRLTKANAKWIYDNIPDKTKIYIYKK